MCRISASADKPVFAWVIRWIARNHVASGSLVCSNSVPLTSED